MKPQLISILACPQCRHALHLERDRLPCKNCAGSFRCAIKLPSFLPEAAQIVPAEHKSNPLGAEYEAILREGKKFVLNIGAGATATRSGRNFACIETRITGDSHSFPATAP